MQAVQTALRNTHFIKTLQSKVPHESLVVWRRVGFLSVSDRCCNVLSKKRQDFEGQAEKTQSMQDNYKLSCIEYQGIRER
jgi:hypothetical protein